MKATAAREVPWALCWGRRRNVVRRGVLMTPPPAPIRLPIRPPVRPIGIAGRGEGFGGEGFGKEGFGEDGVEEDDVGGEELQRKGQMRGEDGRDKE